MALTRVATAVLALELAACGELRSVVTLSSDIQKQYHLAANVAVNTSGTMRITFSTAALDSKQMDDAAREKFARDVATFAKARYAKSAQLNEIVINSVVVTSTGPMVVSRTTPQFSFPVRDLP